MMHVGSLEPHHRVAVGVGGGPGNEPNFLAVHGHGDGRVVGHRRECGCRR